MTPYEALKRSYVTPKKRVYCSFCGKSDCESELMITDSNASVCAACIDLCSELVETHRRTYAGDVEYQSWAQHLTPND